MRILCNLGIFFTIKSVRICFDLNMSLSLLHDPDNEVSLITPEQYMKLGVDP
jgi:hypothetical protein